MIEYLKNNVTSSIPVDERIKTVLGNIPKIKLRIAELELQIAEAKEILVLEAYAGLESGTVWADTEKMRAHIDRFRAEAEALTLVLDWIYFYRPTFS